MGGFCASTNSIFYFLLRPPAVAVPCPPPFRRLPPLRRSPSRRRQPPIDNRAAIHTGASLLPMESILENGSNEVKRDEKITDSPNPQEAECHSSSPELPPTPPEKPEPGDCCGSGCVPCIWDLYYEELEGYAKKLDAYNSRVSSNKKKEHS